MHQQDTSTLHRYSSERNSSQCGCNPYHTDNRNIKADCLYKDGLHLIDKGKIVLANNFIINLNQNFLTHIHHPLDAFLNQECISKLTSNSIEADLQILQEDRIKFHNDPPLGYLNINSLHRLKNILKRLIIRLFCFE